MKGCISMKKPINEAALKMAIAYAQSEYSYERRTNRIPKSDLPVAVSNIDRFATLVSDAYEYCNDMRGVDNIIERDVSLIQQIERLQFLIDRRKQKNVENKDEIIKLLENLCSQIEAEKDLLDGK